MRSHNVLMSILAGITFLCSPLTSVGQLSPAEYDYPNNHLPWYTIESEHFQVHFQKGNSRSAQVTSQIAEEIYPDITSLYQLEPDSKTDIVLRDRQDYSNGAAYFFDNQIDIWVPSLDTPLRGTHDWLWDVITHEFTHIIQLQAAMKRNEKIPAIYFQWLSYTDVRRPDVLYGYPKGIITYPFASVNVPAWFAEGVAQYQRSDLYYDYWDSHRDMLLRTALLSGTHHKFEEMASFASKNGLERERIYNQGFAFTSFLVDKFGENIVADISKALTRSGTFTIDKAIEKVTGTSGKQLFDEFTNQLTADYQHSIRSLSFTPTKTVEQHGIFNFYPKISPDGKRLAYLSNKRYRSGGTQLFIQSTDDSLNETYTINVGERHTSDYKTGRFQNDDPVIDRIRSTFTFSEDGNSIVFTRQKLNKFGEQYNDLFLYNLNTKKTKRLTNSQRISSPELYPAGNQLIAVQQTGSSTNLVTVDLKTSSITKLTTFSDGQQVYTPASHPNGDHVYFSYSDTYTRDIYRLDLNTKKVQPVLQDSLTDYRDPFIDSNGKFLYYAADPDGIFNIYRISLEEPDAEPQQLTSVRGGAFMPYKQNQTLYFAQFKTDGYKITSIDVSENPEISTANRYHRPTDTALKFLNKSNASAPGFTSLDPISQTKMEHLGKADSLVLDHRTSNTKNSVLRPYENTYTSFSLYPVIRFDNYSKLNGNNGRLLTAGKFGELGENLLRDMKLGTYFSSRDVTDRLNIFGGAMFGIASEPSNGIGDFFSPSRLTDLDRDLFLITEYQGLPFIEKRWSPTISIELYNMRRNVRNGLTIEEFPCTSCLPDTTQADIAYNIWEADIYLRNKINEYNLIEIGAGYRPYRVQTDGFFSRELQQFIPSSSSEYFRGTTFTAAHIYERFAPYPNQDVAPVGLRTSLRYSYEPNKLLDDYEIEEGTLSPVYKSAKNQSIEASVQLGVPVGKDQVINFYGRGFSYLNQPDDFFYLDYIGGFNGMRSYPYFAIGGNTTAMTQFSYTFPLLQGLSKQVGRHTLDKLFLRLFAEAGNGWRGPLDIGDNLKTGIGTELRFAFNSYYLFPLKLFVSGAYGFNKFDVNLPEAFITESTGGSVQYGNDLIFHFGLTFDFNVLNHD